jgi:hypothetical protein
VVPKVIEVFDSSKGKLPLITQLLILFSDFLRNWGIYVALAIVGAIVSFVYWLKNPDHRRRFHRFQLRVPLFGKLVRGFNTARFTRTFSILTASAEPVQDAHRGGVAGAGRCSDRALAGRQQVVPAHDGAPDLVGRIERRARYHARKGRHQPGAGTRLHDGRAGGIARTSSDCCDGSLRHGHRFCNVDAHLSDEQPDTVSNSSILPIAWRVFPFYNARIWRPRRLPR